MTGEEKIKVLLSSILLLSYALSMLIKCGTYSGYEACFIDIFYAVGSTFGIGSYLIIDSFRLKRLHECYLFSAGVFFVGLALIYTFDAVSNWLFETYWYVTFNLLITFLCYTVLILRRQFIRH